MSERLTKRDFENDFCHDCEYYGEPNGCNRSQGTCLPYDWCQEAWDKLAAHEDIGTVEKVADYKKVATEKLNDIVVISNWVEYTEEEVRQGFVKFLQAEQEGRILPDCKKCKHENSCSIECIACISSFSEEIASGVFENHFEPAAKEDAE